MGFFTLTEMKKLLPFLILIFSFTVRAQNYTNWPPYVAPVASAYSANLLLQSTDSPSFLTNSGVTAAIQAATNGIVAGTGTTNFQIGGVISGATTNTLFSATGTNAIMSISIPVTSGNGTNLTLNGSNPLTVYASQAGYSFAAFDAGGGSLHLTTPPFGAGKYGTNWLIAGTYYPSEVVGAPNDDFLIFSLTTQYAVQRPIGLFLQDSNGTPGIEAQSAYFNQLYVGGIQIGNTNGIVYPDGSNTNQAVASTGASVFSQLYVTNCVSYATNYNGIYNYTGLGYFTNVSSGWCLVSPSINYGTNKYSWKNYALVTNVALNGRYSSPAYLSSVMLGNWPAWVFPGSPTNQPIVSAYNPAVVASSITAQVATNAPDGNWLLSSNQIAATFSSSGAVTTTNGAVTILNLTDYNHIYVTGTTDVLANASPYTRITDGYNDGYLPHNTAYTNIYGRMVWFDQNIANDFQGQASGVGWILTMTNFNHFGSNLFYDALGMSYVPYNTNTVPEYTVYPLVGVQWVSTLPGNPGDPFNPSNPGDINGGPAPTIAYGTNVVTNVVTRLSNFPASVDVEVDPINGNDSMGTIGGYPFKTISAAMALAVGGERWHFKKGTNDLTTYIWCPINAYIDCDSGAVFTTRDTTIPYMFIPRGTCSLNGGSFIQPLWAFTGPALNIQKLTTNFFNLNHVTVSAEHGCLQTVGTLTSTNLLTINITDCNFAGGSWVIELLVGGGKIEANIVGSVIAFYDWETYPTYYSGTKINVFFAGGSKIKVSGNTIIVKAATAGNGYTVFGTSSGGTLYQTGNALDLSQVSTNATVKLYDGLVLGISSFSGSTNVTAATQFTASFGGTFADTNYTASVSGNGIAVAGQYVSNKTPTNCIFHMTAATGNVDWIATHP